MKDTDHPVRHPRVHLGDRANAQGTRGCARRDEQETSLGARGENLVGAAEKGRNYLLQLRLQHLLQLGRRISSRKNEDMNGTRKRKMTQKKSPDWAGATPLFRVSRPNVRGSPPPSQTPFANAYCSVALGNAENLSDNMSDILYEEEGRSQLSILKAPPKQPKTVTVQARVEESVKSQLELYAEFIDASPSYVITEALKLLFRKDDDFRRWADQHANNHNNEKAKGDALAKAV
jgi:hypothetical protein